MYSKLYVTSNWQPNEVSVLFEVYNLQSEALNCDSNHNDTNHHENLIT